MSILALVTSPEEIVLVVPWAAKVASVRESSLTILCWSYSPTPQPPEIMNIEESDVADRSCAPAVALMMSPTE